MIGENLCRLYSAKHGIQAIALRYATVYGERQHYRGVNALYIMENYDRIMRGEAPVIPDDGSEVHDYIHVADVARANVMAMASDVTGESFTVVSGVATDLNRVVALLLKITGSDLKPVYKTDDAARAVERDQAARFQPRQDREDAGVEARGARSRKAFAG